MKINNEFIVILITTKNNDEAKKIAKILLTKNLIACANIINKVESIYNWNEKLVEDSESLIILKSEKKLFNKISKIVKENHSYSVPEILALPIIDGDNDYLAWIKGCLVV
ncbi:MAG: divalent-cation tolerance protein CutA [Elusimicrobiota bacterium]|jgi:periplasmic divalent cation tolerance protein|nr:divalent-cation tolerance protein CutA [Elusimicrobiota bacterium]